MAKVVATEKTPYPPVPNIVEQQVGEKRWQFEKRMREHNLKKGSRFMAMNIEPFMWERHRVARTMTDEDRFLRKQWLRDQILSPDEPRRVPALEAKSGLRGYLSIPLDKLETSLTRTSGSPFFGFMVRDLLKKGGLAFGSVLFLYIYFQNKQNTWEHGRGINIRGKRIPRVPGDDMSKYPADPARFGWQGFDKRTTEV